jgi:polyferredoxin
MNAALAYQFLADTVLLAHFAIVVFVVGGLVLVVAGNWLGWPWVNRLWFRFAHLAAIATVVAESWLGITCPLTRLESWLRLQTGAAPYGESFIEHWVQRVLFYEAPSWVFAGAYTVFGLLVVVAWWRFPPRRRAPAPQASGRARPLRAIAAATASQVASNASGVKPAPEGSQSAVRPPASV